MAGYHRRIMATSGGADDWWSQSGFGLSSSSCVLTLKGLQGSPIRAPLGHSDSRRSRSKSTWQLCVLPKCSLWVQSPNPPPMKMSDLRNNDRFPKEFGGCLGKWVNGSLTTLKKKKSQCYYSSLGEYLGLSCLVHDAEMVKGQKDVSKPTRLCHLLTWHALFLYQKHPE